MSGHTFGEFPPDETERPTGAAEEVELARVRASSRSAPGVAPADRTTQTDSRGAQVVALTGDELVARALAILADEKERWHSGRSVNLWPRASS
jgi:hypothetical protein